MLRLHVLSDLHLEFADFTPAKVACDAVVLAGDIHQGVEGVLWARRMFPDIPIVYVPGNHEYYGHDWDQLFEALVRTARQQEIHLLDRDSVVIAGVRILGCTLWTDFDLFGELRRDAAMAAAEKSLFDYRYIRCQGRLIAAADTRARHLVDRAWLAAQLDVADPNQWRTTVVVTHMVPTDSSTAARYKTQALSAGFASHLDCLLPKASVWIHGHTHDSYDYVLNDCRVVCNPRGYRHTGRRFENKAFDENKLVAI